MTCRIDADLATAPALWVPSRNQEIVLELGTVRTITNANLQFKKMLTRIEDLHSAMPMTIAFSASGDRLLVALVISTDARFPQDGRSGVRVGVGFIVSLQDVTAIESPCRRAFHELACMLRRRFGCMGLNVASATELAKKWCFDPDLKPLFSQNDLQVISGRFETVFGLVEDTCTDGKLRQMIRRLHKTALIRKWDSSVRPIRGLDDAMKLIRILDRDIRRLGPMTGSSIRINSEATRLLICASVLILALGEMGGNVSLIATAMKASIAIVSFLAIAHCLRTQGKEKRAFRFRNALDELASRMDRRTKPDASIWLIVFLFLFIGAVALTCFVQSLAHFVDR